MITVLMGAPGSGKSTWVQKNAQGIDHVYCLDGIRVNPELDISAFSNLRRMQAIKAVENGQSLIADATHTIKAHRDVWRHLADRMGLPTRIVLFDTPLATLLEVQKHREFPVKRSVVVDHHRKLQLARHAIDREGWGSIEVITWK
jgi:predicted kinase